MRHFVVGVVVVLLVVVGFASATKGCRYTINYGSFIKDALFQVATAQGYFDDAGVCVNFFAVAGSVQQFDSFAQGAYDIIWTAFDNIVARTVLLGYPYSVVAAHDAGAQYVVLGNTDNGINSLADLQGKPIAVDAPDSGLVFALRKLLATNGITGYTFQPIGGFARVGALNSGWWNRTDPTTGQFLSERVYATINSWPGSVFIPPNVKVLARVQDDPSMNPFQNIILAVNATVAANDDKADAIVAFLTACIRASYFINDPRNEAAIEAIFQTGFGQTPQVAVNLYDTITNAYGLPNGIRPNRAGMINSMAARAFTAAIDPTCVGCGFPAGTDFAALTASQAGGLVDMTLLRRALLGLSRDNEIAFMLD